MGKGEAISSHAKVTIWSAAYVNLIAISFFQSMGQQMMNTIVPLYAYELGATAQVVGMVAGAFAVTALLLRPLVGPAFDAFSKKKILIVAISVITAATLLYSVSTSIPMLILTRFLHGAGIACAAPMTYAMAGDALPAEKMNSGLAIFSLAFAVAQSVGPAFGLWLVSLVGYQWTFRVSTVAMSVACTLAVLLKAPPTGERKPYQLKLSRMFAKEAAVPAVLNGMLSAPFSCIAAFIVIYGQLEGVGNMGYYFMLYALCMLATRPIFGALSDRFGVNKIIPIGLICFATSLFLISGADTLEQFLVAALVGACGYGAVIPLLQSLGMLCTPRNARGAASNATFIGFDFGNLVGPTLGGSLVGLFTASGVSDAQAYSYMYQALIVPVIVTFAVFLLTRKRTDALVAKNSGALR